MIAQGDFLRILNAKSEERKQIFQKIFGTGMYAELQNELKERNSACEAEREYIRASVISALSRVREETEFEQRDELLRLMGSDALLERTIPIIELLAAFEKNGISELEKRLSELKNEGERLVAGKTEAENIAKDRMLLESARADAERLEKRADGIREKKAFVERAKKAELLRPDDAVLQKLKRNLSELEGSILKCREEKEKISVHLQAAGADLEKAVSEHERIPLYEAEYAGIDRNLPVLKAYKAGLSDVSKAVSAYELATGESLDADKHCLAVKEGFYRSQGALLALELRDGEPCPVCGSRHHPNPAEFSEDSVSKEELEEAEKLREKKAENLRIAENAKVSAQIALETAKNRLAEFGISSEEETEELEKRAKHLKQTIESAAKAYSESEARYKKEEVELEKKQATLVQLQRDREKTLSEYKEQEKKLKAEILRLGFSCEAEFRSSLATPRDIDEAEKEISEYDGKLRSVGDLAGVLEAKLAGMPVLDIERINLEVKENTKLSKALSDELSGLSGRLAVNLEALSELKRLNGKLVKLDKKWAVVNELYRSVSGQMSKKMKLSFETYVQRFYFKQVIAAANRRLRSMTDGMFTLRCNENAKDMRSQSGLDIEVLDRGTGAWRDVSTLSGGESFMTAMALALGLSDIAQSRSGGIRLDSMFIDEGFGSLDENSLRQALELLTGLADGKRLIGVISHVPELKERIDKKIIVRKKLTGSEVELEA